MALTYEIVTRNRVGKERVREFVSDDALDVGSVLFVDGRWWLIERDDPDSGEVLARLFAKPGRYRIRLQHPDGREEIGAFRRVRADAPRLGHAFTTVEDGRLASWSVVDERLERDEAGEPYLDLLAERDYEEVEAPPDHELEHALVRRHDERVTEAAAVTFTRARETGLSVELVALEPGEAPDWQAAGRFIDVLILEEIEDDLFEMCGVDTDADPRETWLEKVKERLREDLAQFRADVEDDHDEIEEWDFLGGRVFASVGSPDDESDPDSGHGWMCRLVDSEALGAAGFARIRKRELSPEL
ncbi:MAG TPA: hypothetical protein VGQ84_04895 [Gaiellaceae bacterium]|nr:hypothetical protein [Gaiellaceae bacterium]